MKPSFTQLALALAPAAHAFPRALLESAARDPEMVVRALEASKQLIGRQTGADLATAIFEPINTFNAAEQYIDVSEGSGHEYVAPTSTDLRGPCPGLNAFANHGFLPHDGYATTEQFIDACQTVVGMGPLLAGFLSVLGSTIDGDLLAWSIAGTPTEAQSGVAADLAGNGLVGSHNKYEGDASPTRPDLYQAGNNYITQTSQFQEMIDYSPGGYITIDSLTEFRNYRFNTQISTNPYYFNGPFSGVLVQPAAYTFIFRFMANHSEEYPTGQLSSEVAASWFGVTGTNGSYDAVHGTEQIPANWYRRALAYPYEVDYFLADVINAAVLHPEFLDIGGNLGVAGEFVGVDITNLTGGVYNLDTLLDGNNLGCFVYEVATGATPDVVVTEVDALQTALGDIITALGCPNLMAIESSQLEQFPGYAKDPVYGTTTDILNITAKA